MRERRGERRREVGLAPAGPAQGHCLRRSGGNITRKGTADPPCSRSEVHSTPRLRGTSPQVQGTRYNSRVSWVIPACAGNFPAGAGHDPRRVRGTDAHRTKNSPRNQPSTRAPCCPVRGKSLGLPKFAPSRNSLPKIVRSGQANSWEPQGRDTCRIQHSKRPGSSYPTSGRTDRAPSFP